MDTLNAKKAFVADVQARDALVYLPHDSQLVAARVRRDANGKPQLVSA
jgi:hypothetical protein